MHIEIDQSGRVETLTHDTALGFSNGKSFGIFIDRKTKRLVFATLKQRFKEVRNPEVKVFTAAVFLLIRDHMRQIENMIIDLEYMGHENVIKSTLLRHIWKIRPNFEKEQIAFQSIGKKSGAHYKAYGIFAGKQKPDREINAEELLSLL